MRLPLFLTLSLSFAPLTAQTQLVRGKVEDITGTARFQLACTQIPLTSTVLNLATLTGQDLLLQVVNTGSATQPSLDVRAATPTTGLFSMGNLRLNQASRWQVQSPAGTSAWVFFTSTAQTTYLPAGAAGTWLLSPATMQFLNYGVTNAANVFEFTFTMPNAPELVGLSITSQAVLLSGTTPLLSDADCKTVQR